MRGVRSKIQDKNNQDPEQRLDTTSLRAFETDIDTIILARTDKREAAHTSRLPLRSRSKPTLMIDDSRDNANCEATKGPLENIPDRSASVSSRDIVVSEMREPAPFEAASAYLQAVKDGISAFVSTMEAYDGGFTVCMDYEHGCGDFGGTSSDLSSSRLGSVVGFYYKRKETEVLAANADIEEASQENQDEETIDHRGREKCVTSIDRQFDWETFFAAF
jgi:hypothetical protein